MIHGTGLAEQINKYQWWHSIDFGNGIISPGQQSQEHLKQMADIYFSEPVAGKSVTDIGAWDGFHSVEAEKRGAKSVTSVDTWDHWGNRACIDLVKEYVAPKLQIMPCDVYDLSPDKIPVHDVVLFAGVIYHLRHPLFGLEKVSSVTGELLIVETHLDAMDVNRAAMVMYPGKELNNDPTKWWGPNRHCMEAMLRDVGFRHLRFTPHPATKLRGIFHARR